MANNLSNYLETSWLDTLGGTTFSGVTCYVRLHTGDPGEASSLSNGATEATMPSISFNAAVNNQMTNDTAISWTSVAAEETYSHISIWDSNTTSGTNMLWSGALTASVAVVTNDDFEIAAGQLTLSLD